MNHQPIKRVAGPGLFFAVLVLVPSAWAWQADSEFLNEVRGTTMGVVSYRVQVYGDCETAELEQAVQETLESVNRRMSTWLEDSEVSRFNAGNSTEWFPVSGDTAEVVVRALEIAEWSGGAFDITVQPLVQLWKFGTDRDSPAIPDPAAIAAELERTGYKNLQARTDPPALRKTIPGLQIDLSAIAKGYAVDRVAERLEQMGLGRYLVEVGGEVRAAGQKNEQRPWNVGIEEPVPGVRRPWRVIALSDRSLASSGDYRNFHEIEGRRYSHTIDPRTGSPVQHQVAAASVLAADCMTADAIATAIMVLGSQAGLELATRAGVEAVVLERSASGIQASQTAAFPEAVPRPSSGESILGVIAIASVFFLLAVAAMAVGVLFGRERIRGSCGGIAVLDNPNVKPECSLCSRAAECDELKDAIRQRQGEETGEES